MEVASFTPKVRMLKAEVMETLLHGFVTRPSARSISLSGERPTTSFSYRSLAPIV